MRDIVVFSCDLTHTSRINQEGEFARVISTSLFKGASNTFTPQMLSLFIHLFSSFSECICVLVSGNGLELFQCRSGAFTNKQHFLGKLVT